jgi:hypothetical protein
MMRAPMAPLLLCLMGSDDERFVAPNSTALPTHFFLTPSGCVGSGTFTMDTAPAYHS